MIGTPKRHFTPFPPPPNPALVAPPRLLDCRPRYSEEGVSQVSLDSLIANQVFIILISLMMYLFYFDFDFFVSCHFSCRKDKIWMTNFVKPL